MNLALFDFDGTISYKDSLEDFIIYVFGKPRYYSGLIYLSPLLLAWKLKLIHSEKAKARLLAYFFKGWDETVFKKKAYRYSIDCLDQIIRAQAMKKIAWHKARGDEVVVVSASLRYWLEDWCPQQGISLIATELDFYQQKVTGQFAGKNCQGKEKVRRIQAVYDLSQFERIYAYGDSKGDCQMLSLAHEAYYRNFR